MKTNSSLTTETGQSPESTSSEPVLRRSQRVARRDMVRHFDAYDPEDEDEDEDGDGRTAGPLKLSRQEKIALKDLIILDLWNAVGKGYHDEEVMAALGRGPVTPAMARHLRDEAGRYADVMSPEVNALMSKIVTICNME